MATKKQSTIKATKDSSAIGADDLQILHPEKTRTIAGRKITCREYAFIEELELRQHTQPIIDGMIDLINLREDISDREIDLLIAKNIKSVQELMAISADVSIDFIRSLNREDGCNFYLLWWSVCGPFFVSCAKDYVMSKKIAAEQRSLILAKLAAGQMSTQNSSHMDTTVAPSGNTHTDN